MARIRNLVKSISRNWKYPSTPSAPAVTSDNTFANSETVRANEPGLSGAFASIQSQLHSLGA